MKIFKKILFIFTLLLSIGFSNTYNDPFSLKIKVSDFFYQDTNAKRIFDDLGFLTSIEASYEIYNYKNFNFNTFFEYGILKDNGFDEKTLTDFKLFLSPLSIGINTYYSLNNTLSIYLKTAPNWLYVSVKNNYPAPPNKVSKSTFGATFGLGVLINLNNKALFDLFLNYLYDSKKIVDSTSNISFNAYLGGFQLGIGAGIKF
jgi:hypothetical protein